MIRHYAHEVMRRKKETSSQMKGMQRKSEERDKYSPPFFGCYPFTVHCVSIRDRQVIEQEGQTNKTRP